MQNRYLALLRGINVGGNNLIKMKDLAACFENMGFSQVKTYIQSGNVVFGSESSNQEVLTLQIEKKLSEQFGYQSKIVLITKEFLQTVVENKPEGFGQFPETHRYDVLFVKPPLKTSEVYVQLPVKEGVDKKWEKNGVIYFSRNSAQSAQSQLNKFVSSSLYKQVTIRNWNTTQKLYSLAVL